MLPEPLILGLLMFQVLYSLVQWYFFRRPEYPYYAAYSILVGLYFLLKYNSSADEMIHIGSFSFNELLVDKSIMFIAFYCYIEFAKLFLINIVTHTRLYKVVTFVSRFMLVYAIVNFIALSATKDYSSSIKVNFILSFILYFLFMTVLFMVIKRKIILGKFLVLGSLFMALGAILSVIFGFSTFNHALGNRDAIIFFQVGVILELICLNTGLIYKTKLYAGGLLEQTILPDEIYKEKNEQKKISAVLQTMRKEISYELQTELGDGLSGIKLMSEMIKQRMGNQHSKELERISENSERLVQSMNEIVWSLNHVNDNLPGMVSYLREYAMSFMEQVGIACEIIVPDNIDDIQLSGDVRRHIFLSVKEALHNVVKHAEAKNVKISISLSGKLIIIIADDGKGLQHDIPQYGIGNGLRNMERRMQQLHGEFKVVSHQGTTVYFTVPIAPLTHIRKTT
jgi:signal transduction histidine kinase